MLSYETSGRAIDAVRDSLKSWEAVQKISSENPTEEDAKHLINLCFDNYFEMVKTVCYILETEAPSSAIKDISKAIGMEINLAEIIVRDSFGVR